MKKPLVALVGRPNVGKSTLFNRLVGERRAVISEIPGTTRDRNHGDVDWNGVEFMVIDTGGIEVYQPKDTRDVSPLAEGSLEFVEQIKAQALIAINDADVIVMVVDAQQGITAADEDIATILQKTNKPVLVAANKTDNVDQYDQVFEFYGLGLGEVIGVSAIHGLGSGDLLDAVVSLLPDAPELSNPEDDEDVLRIAIVGRPNVGKSSLLNRLLGEDRAIVSDVSGTTRDALDTPMKWHGQDLILIDTAGIRRRGRIDPGIEKFSVLRALKAIERCDVALLLVDPTEGITAQDAHVADMVLQRMKSVVIVVNKWDLIEKDNSTMNTYIEEIRHHLSFMSWAPIIFISVLTGQRIHQVLETTFSVWEERYRRIPTSELNRVVREAVARHAPSTKDPRRLRIYYATQVRTNPPTFLFHVNDHRLVHFSYERYLENCLREAYPLTGTPIRLSFRSRGGNLSSDD
ncbi:MAG: ribosome biogenesis GTPase Der [Anaerolineales bacterium]|nr:ribosome biogenesis GTPase Der [Anaerolineales bacterium]